MGDCNVTKRAEVARLDALEECWKAGYEAFEKGASIHRNPHPRGSEEREHWETGWTCADFDKNGIPPEDE